MFWGWVVSVAKWGLALALWIVLWAVAEDPDSPNSRTVPSYVCFADRVCERVIRQEPDTTPTLPGAPALPVQPRPTTS